MPENRNYMQESEQLAKQYEINKHRYFELDEFIAISDYYVSHNNYKNAIEVSNTAETFYPSSFEIKTIKADVYIRNNEFEKAKKIIKNIEHDSDSIIDVYILKGEICIKQNKYKSAEQLFDKAITESAEDEKGIITEVICDFLITMHQIHLAKKYLELAQKTMQDFNYDLIYWLAKCYEHESEYEKAASIYEKMTEINPFDENIWDDLGDVYMILSEYEKAIRAFDLRLAASNENANETLINKAECLSNLGKNDEAIKIYNKILESDKENLDAMFGIAKCYEREEIYDIAEIIYSCITSQNPQYSDAYFGLAMIYSQKNEFEAAEQFMYKAMNNTEIIPAYLVQMSKILLMQDKINEAKQTMEIFIHSDICKSDSHAWLLYAEIIACEDIEKSIDILEKKYNEDFYSSAEICYHLTYYHFINENISQSVVYMKRSLELDSEMAKLFIDLCPEMMLNKQIMKVYKSFKTKK
jgi:tetratricopeptide (TPR) repeat protein